VRFINRNYVHAPYTFHHRRLRARAKTTSLFWALFKHNWSAAPRKRGASERRACRLRGTGHAYSPSKVIHRWRGEPTFAPPQPSVNNFGGGKKMICEQRSTWLNQSVEHAGSGRRIPRSNVPTFSWRRSLRDPAPCRKGTLRTLRLQVQTAQRRTSISASIRQGRVLSKTKIGKPNYECNG
jgi:hypothetical protein